MTDLANLKSEWDAADLWLEEVAAKWLEARASGDMRAWRTMSTKLDAAMAEARHHKNRYEKAAHRAEKRARLTVKDPTNA